MTTALTIKGNLADGIVSLDPESNLKKYLTEIRKFPILSADKEYMLAKRWQTHKDEAAAHSLVTSHLRLVAKIAMKYKGYGLPVGDLISEGNIGMMQAVKKFDPDRGFRLATYAMWWIKASINEHVLNSWSMVKIGTTAAQKKLFFGLRKMKSKLQAWDDKTLSPEQINEIADALDVPTKDVEMMDARMGHGGDSSLNARISDDSENGAEWQDWIEDETQNHEEQIIEQHETTYRHNMLLKAMQKLTEREQIVIKERSLTTEPKTLEDLSSVLNLSRERIRQIEAEATAKLQKIMTGKTSFA